MQLLAASALPQSLQPVFALNYERLQDALSDAQQALINSVLKAQPALAAQLVKTFAVSQFAAQTSIRDPDILCELLESGQLTQPVTKSCAARLQAFVGSRCASSNIEEAVLLKALRDFRAREMLRLIWRDANDLSELMELTAELSELAAANLQLATDFLYSALSAELGVPYGDASGEPQPFVVLGMGKLGADELNLSSDIDLIFAYPETGRTRFDTGVSAEISPVVVAKSLSNKEFFLRLGQGLIKLIGQRTADGFVFRVDMRLRPYGQSGALVLSFDALEEYYQSQGREWERYAMIKAAPVAGDLGRGRELLRRLQPFVYRRYVDFAAIESLRDMKAMIVREVARKGLKNNIKLGAGGIREVEFIVQSFQLMRGGQDVALRQNGLLAVLKELRKRALLSEQAANSLHQAYFFLRNTEHALQALEDAQTQELPADPLALGRVAFALSFDEPEAFMAALATHQENVSACFADVIEPLAESNDEVADLQQWTALWEDAAATPDGPRLLGDGGFDLADDSWQLLSELLVSRKVQSLQTVARGRLDKLMPVLLSNIAQCKTPALTLQRILPLIETILRRSSYLLLLIENRQALSHLVTLCAESSWIAEQLVCHPMLLDELLDGRTLFRPPDLAALRDTLHQHILRIPEEDEEAQLQQLRYFKLSHCLRVAAAEVIGALPLMKVSDYLTSIAEVILQYVLQLAWQQLTAKHGIPPECSVGENVPRFIVVAYGKFGGIELGHSSDLDLVFIYRGKSSGSTDGERPLDTATFYTRLGQRIIHILTTRTGLGELYEVDMRLRPSGDSGLLVSSDSGFADYQAAKAWTWEHQALVRARVVAGNAELKQWFEGVRQDTLARDRDLERLAQDVMQMRQKMRAHLLKSLDGGEFHLKHGRGGIVDIEFMVQYAVLAWAVKYPNLCRYTDNIRILDSLEAAGIFASHEAQALRQAYLNFRSALHAQSLQHAPALVAAADFASESEFVAAQWDAMFA